MADNNEWKVPGVFADNCALRKEAEELRRTLLGHNVQINNQYRELKELRNENDDLRKCNDRQAQQWSSLRDDLAQVTRDRDKAMNMAEDRQRRLENAEKEIERLIGRARARAQRITELEAIDKKIAEAPQPSTHLLVKLKGKIRDLEKEVAHFKALAEERERQVAKAEHEQKKAQGRAVDWEETPRPSTAQQYLNVRLLEGTTKGVNGLHAVGQVIGHLQLSRKDTRNIGHWLINSVKAEEEL